MGAREPSSNSHNSLQYGRLSVRSARGALTILELLIVLAILVAIGAMVAPAMVGVLEERALNSAADVAEQQLVLARAHAQTSGRPVEVVYRAGPGRIIARYFEAGERGIGEGDRRAATLRGEEDPFAGGESARRGGDGDFDDDALTWNWAVRTLPRGVRATRNQPSNTNGNAAFADPFTSNAAPPERGSLRAPATERPIRLAVFMPDGSALLATPVWLSNDSARAVRLEVNVWTGLPRSIEELIE